MFGSMKTKLAALGTAALAFVAPAYAGIGADVVTKVEEAATEANLVYVAVIAALAAFFVVKLIRKAL